ncbi:AfsR/SARP family transcriptional regulator [Sphaerisporangium aureirubrum]|uniref:BTAD domain-containing putative transcriptional regulator n=1 Tax=Sphaerisporangium aureirubrum TaxID=1544736 RepID=A0ABW1NHR1_9ACTN
MEFRLLGPIEVWHEGRRLALGGPKPRALLAALLLEPNRVVPADRLIDLLWDDRPPGSARALVQTYVHGLRRALAGAGDLIETRPPGYLARVPGEWIDRTRFDALVEAARQAGAEDAARAYGEAVALWRGNALGGIGDLLRAEAVALDTRRIDVIEERVAAELSLGRYGGTVGELTDLVEAHPLRERARAQLMTALYALGRQSEALAVYQDGRRLLADELGLDPGAELRELHDTILRGDPPPGEAEPRPVTSGVTPAQSPPGVTPAQLPPGVPDFTGRDGPAAELIGRLAAGAPHVSVICGKGGVGKSALAVHVAHAAQAHYPDGQLYADMRGCSDLPAGPEEVLPRFLRALGVPPASLPESFEERRDLYRSVLSRRRVLVVLDDARSERHVRPLLPAGRGCGVLVTSRRRLAGLDGAHLCDLDVLAEPAAVDLLAAIAGRARVAAEPKAALEIVRLCGGLPLAVRTAGGRLSTRRHWSLGTLVERLGDERWRLDELAAGDLEVRSSVAFSYGLLDEEAKTAFRRLGLMGLPDFPSWVAAPLLDLPLREAEDVVERLVDANLLDFVATDAVGQTRYRLHDLLRVFAKERALREDDADAARTAVERLIGAWVHLVAQAAAGRPPGEIALSVTYSSARPLDGRLDRRLADNPAGWLESETPALIAAVERATAMDLDVAACDLTIALSFSVFFVGTRLSEWSRSQEAALASARRAGNRVGEAMLLAARGHIYYEMDKFPEAHECFAQAHTLYEAAGDVRGRGVVLTGIGNARREQSLLRGAADALDEALAIFRGLGDAAATAHAARLAATVHLELGDFGRLPELLTEALRTYRAIGSVRGEALTLRTIGLAHRAAGDLTRAEALCERALALFQKIGDPFMGAYAVQALAKTRLRQGRGEPMLAPLREAMEVCRVHFDRWGQAFVRRTIGELHLAAGHLDQAAADLAEAAAQAEALDSPLLAARARRDLARTLDRLGRPAEARDIRERALAVFAAHGAREHAEEAGLPLPELPELPS